jgi:hypothetical protein
VVKPLEPAELMAAITDVRGRSKSG